MKRLFLFAFLGVFWLAATFIQSCDECIGPLKLKLDSIVSYPLRITGIETLGEANPTPFFTYTDHNTDEDIKFDSLGLNIFGNHNQMAHIRNKRNTGFISSAYACDPVIIFEDTIVNISIFSSQDYNAGHKKGDDLNSIMTIRKGYKKDGVTIPTFENDITFLADNYNLLLTFTGPPEENKSHDLTIQISLGNGRKLETIFKDLKITK